MYTEGRIEAYLLKGVEILREVVARELVLDGLGKILHWHTARRSYVIEKQALRAQFSQNKLPRKQCARKPTFL
jgi:hypothetical protein